MLSPRERKKEPGRIGTLQAAGAGRRCVTYEISVEILGATIDLRRHRWSGNLGWVGNWRMCLASDIYGIDGWMEGGDER